MMMQCASCADMIDDNQQAWLSYPHWTTDDGAEYVCHDSAACNPWDDAARAWRAGLGIGSIVTPTAARSRGADRIAGRRRVLRQNGGTLVEAYE